MSSYSVMQDQPVAKSRDPDRRLEPAKNRFVEGLINSLAAIFLFGLLVLGLAQAVDLLIGVLR